MTDKSVLKPVSAHPSFPYRFSASQILQCVKLSPSTLAKQVFRLVMLAVRHFLVRKTWSLWFCAKNALLAFLRTKLTSFLIGELYTIEHGLNVRVRLFLFRWSKLSYTVLTTGFSSFLLRHRVISNESSSLNADYNSPMDA